MATRNHGRHPRSSRARPLSGVILEIVLGIILGITALGTYLAPAGVPAALARSEATEPVPGRHLCGTRILTPEEARPFVAELPMAGTLPPSLDWRDLDAWTEAKNQETCGGCWAFAAIACVEAMGRIKGAPASLDLSEQHALSCDLDSWVIEGQTVTNNGCCGGTVAVFEFLKERGTVQEEDFPFGNGDHYGPGACFPGSDWETIPCPTTEPKTSSWQVTSWSLLSAYVATVDQIKTALQRGPVWCAYYVYSDFYPQYWFSNQTETPYRHTSGHLVAGHAVLVIGYDDADQCWIVKNSWGPTGPFGDGTFRIAYDSNCSFGINAAICEVDGTTPVEHSTMGRLRLAFR